MIIGFGFNRISAERKNAPKEKMQVNNNVEIKNIEKGDINSPKKGLSAIKFSFVFKSTYEPAVGEIIIEGEVIDLQQDKIVDETLKQWKKDKHVKPEVMTAIMNEILARATVESVVTSRAISLPPPIPIPKVGPKAEEKGNQYIG
jgi:hypothetical protein